MHTQSESKHSGRSACNLFFSGARNIRFPKIQQTTQPPTRKTTMKKKMFLLLAALFAVAATGCVTHVNLVPVRVDGVPQAYAPVGR